MSDIIFEQIRSGGCLSYLIGCPDTHNAIIVDPHSSQTDHYLAIAARDGLHIQYILDTHTHADHFSSSQKLGKQLGVPVIMHRSSVAPFVTMPVDDGETIIVGKLRLRVMYTPGHTSDSICLVLPDRVLTGDTLLIGGTGRTDLPSGDPYQLYDSLFKKLLKLPSEFNVYPAHDYKNQVTSTLAQEIASNPRLQKKERNEFIEQMHALDLKMPAHLTEALRTNRSGGKTVEQMIADAATRISFMSLEEVRRHIDTNHTGDGMQNNLIILDVREKDAYQEGHIPGAINIPRGQLELRINDALPDPTQRVLVYCELGKISTLSAAMLQDMGFRRAIALDGGIRMWKEANYPLESTTH
jgi:glyoxylase-like metal-dependent hydrolase (beta-lactamase superfamily II)/rhodanese-related sulfurtransferase